MMLEVKMVIKEYEQLYPPKLDNSDEIDKLILPNCNSRRNRHIE